MLLFLEHALASCMLEHLECLGMLIAVQLLLPVGIDAGGGGGEGGRGRPHPPELYW